jgi:selenocysteine lyase/cysteine desulfurase
MPPTTSVPVTHIPAINLNNGSYGAAPLPILRARSAYAAECERDPNKYMKRTYLPLLTKARQAAADLIGAGGNVDEVVFVPNASSGVQLVLRELDWEDGDVILVCMSSCQLGKWEDAVRMCGRS